MKFMRYLLMLSTITIVASTGAGVQAQNTEHGRKEDPSEFFEKQRERMERFHEKFTFPDDSLQHFYPKWQQLPRHQKKSAIEIEI